METIDVPIEYGAFRFQFSLKKTKPLNGPSHGDRDVSGRMELVQLAPGLVNIEKANLNSWPSRNSGFTH